MDANRKIVVVVPHPAACPAATLWLRHANGISLPMFPVTNDEAVEDIVAAGIPGVPLGGLRKVASIHYDAIIEVWKAALEVSPSTVAAYAGYRWLRDDLVDCHNQYEEWFYIKVAKTGWL